MGRGGAEVGAVLPALACDLQCSEENGIYRGEVRKEKRQTAAVEV